ncbi:MAG: glycosyltransferase family 9 protein [bacterium]
MQKVLLLNLMRMGDLIQTTPLIEALRRRSPEARIDLVYNEAFREVASRMDADRLHPFPLRDFGSRAGDGRGTAEACAFLQEYVSSVNRDGPYDLVFNLTPSRSAASLASLFRARSRLGMGLEEDGTWLPQDPWAAYLVAVMSNRRANPFHLVDIWRRSLGLDGARTLHLRLGAEDAERGRQLLAGCGVRPEKDVLIGLQVSASQKEKCWSEREFIRLGRALSQGLGARVLVFGVAAEAPQCARVAAGVPEAVNLAGRTDLGSLAACLQACRLLVTNDTGTLHVATAVATPVLVVSVGPVFFRETGPYGEGHAVLQAAVPCAPCPFDASCQKPVCKETVRAELVYGAALQMLRFGRVLPDGLPASVACYRSGFDQEGLCEFTPCGPAGEEEERIGLHKRIWLSLLEGKPLPAAAAGAPGSAGQGLRTEPGLALLGTLLRRGSQLLDKIAAASTARQPEPDRIRVYCENLRQVERDLRGASLAGSELAPFVHYLLLRREAMRSQTPLAFLGETRELYRGMWERLSEPAAIEDTRGGKGSCKTRSFAAPSWTRPDRWARPSSPCPDSCSKAPTT